MNHNSLDAYATVNLSKGERQTMEWVARYGPASQSELIAACCANEPSFQVMEDAQRVKAGQNLYARLCGLKQAGFVVIIGTKPDPWTTNTVDIYAVNPNPTCRSTGQKAVSLKKLLERIDDMEHTHAGLRDSAVAASSIVTMLRNLRAP